MPAIEAVIWDLGGVLARTFDRSGREAWEARLGLEPYQLERIVFGGESSHRATLGQGTVDEVWAEVGARFKFDSEQLSQLQADFWSGDAIDAELVQFIKGLRPAYKTGMITNAWQETRRYIEEVWQIGTLFDEIVVSAEVELAKPDPDIYHLALDRLRVAPQAAVFVDDFSENIQAAQALGMQAVHFQERQQAIQDLQQILAAAA